MKISKKIIDFRIILKAVHEFYNHIFMYQKVYPYIANTKMNAYTKILLRYRSNGYNE